MIISKKKFKEEIAKAVRESEEAMYKERELHDQFTNIYGEIKRLDRARWDLEARVAMLEKKVFYNSEDNVKTNCEGVRLPQ